MVPETEATGLLSRLYRRMINPDSGKMDHILKIHSLDPPTLEDHARMYKRLMFGNSELSRQEREMIAVAVSVANDCHY